ncbi:MAG: DUF4383 domain-containing protein [Nocardioidaceae bacterium]|nr:DUF4383 domain-containing protein [Nocardioidaceae bacterium]
MAANDSSAEGTRRSAPQMIGLAVAAMFYLIGVLGFVPGVTQNYGSMELAGHQSRAELLGLFQISILHNIVHLLFGLVGSLMSRTTTGTIGFLIGGGLVYILLWVYGIFVDMGGPANFVPLNSADNWLHLGLSVGMILLGLFARGISEKEVGAASMRA